MSEQGDKGDPRDFTGGLTPGEPLAGQDAWTDGMGPYGMPVPDLHETDDGEGAGPDLVMDDDQLEDATAGAGTDLVTFPMLGLPAVVPRDQLVERLRAFGTYAGGVDLENLGEQVEDQGGGPGDPAQAAAEMLADEQLGGGYTLPGTPGAT
jgi:hypothetical protein